MCARSYMWLNWWETYFSQFCIWNFVRSFDDYAGFSRRSTDPKRRQSSVRWLLKLLIVGTCYASWWWWIVISYIKHNSVREILYTRTFVSYRSLYRYRRLYSARSSALIQILLDGLAPRLVYSPWSLGARICTFAWTVPSLDLSALFFSRSMAVQNIVPRVVPVHIRLSRDAWSLSLSHWSILFRLRHHINMLY